ncbi:cytochrome c [Kiritimatiellota bacterium B12222]|nr:cytochrome c [Kiritimatiellota bacterium B12222]
MSDADSNKNEDDVKTETPETVVEETVVDENGPVNVGHQDNDLDLKTVKKFIIASFAVTILFFIIMLIVVNFYKSGFEKERGVASIEDRQIPTKADSILQTKPLEDLAEYNELEATRLNTTTNAVDHAVIPIEAAKQLMLAENAFPAVEPNEQEEEVATPMVVVASESVASVEHAPAAVAAPAAPSVQAVAAAPSPAAPVLDPAMVSAGKVIWETQCMAACHTGKKGAIGPNIQKAFGSMRKLENHDPILMDEEYILNSLNNPASQIAKGYPPVMMSFKEMLTDEQKAQVIAYLTSMGKPIVKATPVPTPVPAAVSTPAPVAEEVKAVEPVQVPVTKPALEEVPAEATPQAPAPTPAAQPEAPKAPQATDGIIFV